MMIYPLKFTLNFFSLLAIVSKINCATEYIDHDGNYLVTWEVDFNSNIITFDLIVRTLGYVGFGISPQGGMTSSDIVIAGILPDGVPYIRDFHGVGNKQPVHDKQEDWALLEASENSTHTILKISRLMQTCDNEDIAITNDTTNLIWAIGATDDFDYHSDRRGTYVVNLLDPVIIPTDESDFKKWEMIVETPMPSQPFTYWCTIHKSPAIGEKHHIVGFRPSLNSKEAQKHTHHFVIYKCQNPNGNNTIFEPFVKDSGGECYSSEEMHRRPTQFCSTVFYVWGAGGLDLFLPDHLGFPIGENKDEYYMLEVHYDNPDQLSGVRFQTGVEILYTSNIRQYDAGMMTVGHAVNSGLIIPPKSEAFKIVGHCSSHCTKNQIPETGIKVFNLLLHTHLAGRKMKLRHFREKEELPWISKDDSYHFNYQKNRPLREERKILPGDHLTFECTYDTKSRSRVTIAGYSTTDEMCEAFVWYYPKIPMQGCSSYYDMNRLFPAFGIENVEWKSGFNVDTQPIVIDPSGNLTFADYLDKKFNWTEEEQKELQAELQYGSHIAACGDIHESKTNDLKKENLFNNPLITNVENDDPTLAFYPDDVNFYNPVDECFGNHVM